MKPVSLYKKDSKGKVRVWTIWTEDNVIFTDSGLLDGEQVRSKKTVHEGKNIGKANETTPEDQAESEAKSIMQKKIDKGYGKSAKALHMPLLPMLAHDYKKRGKDIKFPCFVQPKLDGIRCMAEYGEDGEILLVSRTGKVFPQSFSNLRWGLTEVLKPGEIWDGELFTRNLTFEEIAGTCRREEYSESSEKVEFHVFDIVDKDLTFEQRCKILENTKSSFPAKIKLVDTYECRNIEEINRYLQKFINAGFEGAIIRNKDGMYKAGYRSKDLQKYKEFEDSEFEIIGAKSGSGKDEGTVIWICKTGCGTREFDVRPRGTHELRSELYKDRNKYIGQKLTVRYQGWTELSCPRFPVGIAIRNYE